MDLFVRLVPYRLRWAHRWWASVAGYFWLPCPLCSRPFGGHEWRPVEGNPASIPVAGGGLFMSRGICPVCTRAGLGDDGWSLIAHRDEGEDDPPAGVQSSAAIDPE